MGLKEPRCFRRGDAKLQAVAMTRVGHRVVEVDLHSIHRDDEVDLVPDRLEAFSGEGEDVPCDRDGVPAFLQDFEVDVEGQLWPDHGL